MTSPAAKIFFSLAVLVVLGSASFFIYYLYFKTPPPAVTVEVRTPEGSVLVGEPFAVTVSYLNQSDQALKDARLSLVLPEGVFRAGDPSNQRVLEEVVGDVGPGSINQKTFTLIANSGSQSIKRFEAKLRYGIAGTSSGSFETSTRADLTLGPSSVTINFTVPEKVLSGETFDLLVRVRSDAEDDLRNARLTLAYPSGFEFKEAGIEPENGEKSSWSLGNLRRGEEREISIRGTFIGQSGSFFTLSAELGADILGATYVLGAQSATVGVHDAPLALRVTVGGDGAYVARIGEILRYSVEYRNTSEVPLQTVTVRAVLTGDMFDFRTLRTSGSFNSLTNTVTWTRASDERLASIPPGGSGELTLEVMVKEAFPIRRLSDKDFALRVRADGESPTVPPSVSAEKTVAVTEIQTKIQGAVDLQARAYFYDAPSEILNSGPYPPRVNQPTQYTVHWKLVNYATDVRSVRVSAFLRSNTNFTGIVKSNLPSRPVFNASTNEIVWEIPDIAATAGVIGEAPEAIFQVEVTPAVNQVDQDVIFLGETVVEAQDVFTGRILRDTGRELTTALPDDGRITEQNRRVRP